jgi:hypothetical protein
MQEKTSEGEAPEPAVPRRPAATNSPSTPQRIVGRRCALANQRQRRDCGQIGRQHESGHVSDTSAAAGGHIAAGRGRACGWRVTDPARPALTRLRSLPAGPGPPPPAGSPRSAVPPDRGLARRRRAPGRDLAVTLHLTCSAIVRPRGERDDRAGCLPRRAAGTGARRYRKSRREGGRRMAHAARLHRPAARSAAACHRPP